MIRCGCNEARVPTELQIVDFSLVSTSAEHEGTSWIRGIHLPDSDQSSLLTGCGQKVAVSVEGHGRDGALVAHDYGLDALISEGSHFDVALLCVRDRQHAGPLAVQGTQSVWVVARV